MVNVKSETHFEKLKKNYDSLLLFCNAEALRLKIGFSTQTVLKQEFHYVKKGTGLNRIVMNRLENPSGEKDVFIADFSKTKGLENLNSSIKVSSVLLMEGLDSAKEKIREGLKQFGFENLKESLQKR